MRGKGFYSTVKFKLNLSQKFSGIMTLTPSRQKADIRKTKLPSLQEADIR
jgi:hypothetical protein